MNFSLTQLVLISLAYLLVLFGSAHAAENNWIPKKLVKHPLTYVLSLGVFAGSIAFYGALDLAYHYGSNYLLFFVAASAAFLLAPLLLSPLQRIAEVHSLGSIADIFAFRYPGNWVGGTVTLLMLIGVLPLMALQIQAVAVTLTLLNQDFSRDVLALGFCLMMMLFGILFGARHVSTRDKHEGLVCAIAVESLVKLFAMVFIAMFAVYAVFDGPTMLQHWVTENSSRLTETQTTLTEGPARSLLLIFFAGAVALPHIHHMRVTENIEPGALAIARFGFPLFLLLMSLTIPPVLWAGIKLDLPVAPEYFMVALGLHADSSLLVTLAYIGGLSAASGVLIVITLALSSMTLNHILLPLPIYKATQSEHFFNWLLYSRRFLIAAIILLAYGLFVVMDGRQNLASLGIVTFVAAVQFLPGLLGAFIWRGASTSGFMCGLCAGFTVWFAMLMLPLTIDIYSNLQFSAVTLLADLPAVNWHRAVIMSLTANLLLYVVVSFFSTKTVEEDRAAELCLSDSIIHPQRRALQASTISEVKQSLVPLFGASAADAGVNQAMSDLNLSPDERRPEALHRLRDYIEANLASLLGQTIARTIVDAYVPYQPGQSTPIAENIHSIESRIETSRTKLTGLAAELDNLRRYHRQTLRDLPVPVCSIDSHQHILSWNIAMEKLTAVDSEQIIGHQLDTIPQPWRTTLDEFFRGNKTHLLKKQVRAEGITLLLNLHKVAIEERDSRDQSLVIVIEDITDIQSLQDKLVHNERLASIGQLAAGVAHEIGNPVTGIACLAQNLKMETPDQALQEMSDQILDQTERISAILQSLVNFAHTGRRITGLEYQSVNLGECIRQAVHLLSLNPENRGISFTNNCGDDIEVIGDEQRLSQVFVNLLTNACDVSQKSGKITIVSRSKDDAVLVDIKDEGPGISEANLNQVLEPFYTTKEPGQGTGLGLAIAYTIIQEHNGDIYIQSPITPDLRGTCVTVQLPKSAGPDIQDDSVPESDALDG
jgi:PAS domain S-box-containing protein